MEFIESNKVGKIFVHFPVPWDKNLIEESIQMNL